MPISTRYSSRPVLNATRARQGRFGRHVFWVLLVSTILAALGMFFAWGFKSGDLAATKVKATPAQAQSFDAPEPAAVVISQPETTPAR